MNQETALAVARFLQTVGSLSLFGTLSFRALVATADSKRLVWASLALALIGGGAWTLAAASGFGVGVPVLIADTYFGHWLLVRLGLLTMAAIIAGTSPARSRLALGLAALGVGAAVFSSHAMAEADTVGLVVLALHLLAAGLWLGGLLPLLLVARADMHPARRFGPWAAVAVLVLLFTAIRQGLVQIADLPGLLGTVYGQAASAKLLLLAALLGLAALNRWGFVPARRPDLLRVGIAGEILLGLGVLAAATVMGSSAPAVHTAPVWPFHWAPSLIAMAEPELRAEVFDALLALLGAAALLLLGLLVRRVRWPALLAALVIAGFAIPHFDLLLVPAVPTSFQRSPTGFAATGIARAAALYPSQCAACHGAHGEGDGPDAAHMNLPPADLTAPHLWDHADGDLFWMIAHGSRTADGRIGMPGLGGQLGDDDIWAMIDYIRARNAGLAANADGNFDHPVTAPELSIACSDGTAPDLLALRAAHGALLLLREPPRALPVPAIFLDPGPPIAGACVAPDPIAWAGYGVLATNTRDLPQGAWFVIDANGWLRRHGQGDEAGAAALHAAQRDPLPLTEVQPMHHH